MTDRIDGMRYVFGRRFNLFDLFVAGWASIEFHGNNLAVAIAILLVGPALSAWGERALRARKAL